MGTVSEAWERRVTMAIQKARMAALKRALSKQASAVTTHQGKTSVRLQKLRFVGTVSEAWERRVTMATQKLPMAALKCALSKQASAVTTHQEKTSVRFQKLRFVGTVSEAWERRVTMETQKWRMAALKRALLKRVTAATPRQGRTSVRLQKDLRKARFL